MKFFFIENRDSPQLLKKAYNGFTEGLLGIPVYKGRTANGIEYLGKPKDKKNKLHKSFIRWAAIQLEQELLHPASNLSLQLL